MKHHQEIIEHAISQLKDGIGEGVYGCDLHNELFNRDYFIIGRYQAEQFLKGTKEGIFGAIDLIKEYEQDNFGQVSTDLSEPERVLNMYVYIKGEEILQESKRLQKEWDRKLDEEDIKAIIEELENI